MFKNLIEYLFRPTVHDKIYSDAMDAELEEWELEKRKDNESKLIEEIQPDGTIKFYKRYILLTKKITNPTPEQKKLGIEYSTEMIGIDELYEENIK